MCIRDSINTAINDSITNVENTINSVGSSIVDSVNTSIKTAVDNISLAVGIPYGYLSSSVVKRNVTQNYFDFYATDSGIWYDYVVIGLP